jgi:type IV pilus assembly protein PilY1
MRIDFSRMQRSGLLALALTVLGSVLPAANAAAQSGDPDLREIIPYLMLVIDTSGSMERKTACACTTPGCIECLPDCSLPNDSNGLPPKSPPPANLDLKKNRWATTLEALTGSFNNFECTPLARSVANGMTYDLSYYLPYHQPWHCTSQLPGTGCAYNSSASTLSQNADGILDQYSSRVQFGLMTFDGWDTYVGGVPLIPVPDFDVGLSTSVQGLWSYGPNDSKYPTKQGAHFHYPNCTTDYMIDTGARSALATEGSLVSLDSCSGTTPNTPTCPSWCSACPGTQATINQDIQTALLKTRPYGGTPIAASLDDLYFHLKNLNDGFGTCRNRFALLLTDGYPDDDYRSYGCDCATTEDPASPNYCGGPPNIASDMHCPYKTPEQVASDLIHGRAGDAPMIEQLFVVGLAVDDANVVSKLDAIAHAGCPTVGGCDTDGDMHEAVFANDVNRLVQNLGNIIDSHIRPISRSVPAFAGGGTALTSSTLQYQIDTGFKVASNVGQPWTGIIERRTFTCDPSTNLPTTNPIDPNVDEFDQTLNQQPTSLRFLNTVNVTAPATPTGWLYKGSSTAPCGINGCSSIALETVPNVQFGFAATDDASKSTLIDWMKGQNGSVRVGKRLGDIYHSSPVLLSAPRFDTADDAFNRFRERDVVANRPLSLFVASNDGILHAFSMENRSFTVGGFTKTLTTGQEMWGFVPPILLNRLAANLNVHQFTLDGTATIKDVYFSKPPGLDSTGQEYHTVLIIGMREGGKGYIALDITDVTNPIFLWQFTDPHMGLTFAQAAIGQAKFMDYSGGSPVPKYGAVAILPGGVGQIGSTTTGCPNPTIPAMKDSTNTAFSGFLDMPTAGALLPPAPYSQRSDVRCWEDKGRALYFVDVENGQLIKKIHTDLNGKVVLPAPLVSTPALFEGDVGTVASRAFITDANGVIWRVDLSAPDQDDDGTHQHPMTGWTVRPFHDMFWNKGPLIGDLTYQAPLLSVDSSSNLVVIVGTGDNNNFVQPTVENRVASLTEIVNPIGTPSGTPEDYKAVINWEVTMDPARPLSLVPSELVTGSMGLFNGQLFFATFMAVTGTNLCDLGKGRIHAVDYLARDTTDPNAGGTFAPRRLTATELGLDAQGSTVINVAANAAVSNLMVMGLGVTQRPTCETLDNADFSVWGQSTFGVKDSTPPSIYLVAQASGDQSVGSVVQQRGRPSQMGSVEVKLQKKASLTRVTSWATSVD